MKRALIVSCSPTGAHLASSQPPRQTREIYNPDWLLPENTFVILSACVWISAVHFPPRFSPLTSQKRGEKEVKMKACVVVMCSSRKTPTSWLWMALSLAFISYGVINCDGCHMATWLKAFMLCMDQLFCSLGRKCYLPKHQWENVSGTGKTSVHQGNCSLSKEEWIFVLKSVPLNIKFIN